ncbi:MAG: hypothetical protein JWP10_1671 [Nocardioidaceae bacterium]|nr:hypothetical protein [Nocardioidaceae bacterium]
MAVPSFTTFHAPAAPRAVVLLLHGGQQHNNEPVKNRHASWWRMALIGRALKRVARAEDLHVVLLRYRVRGWNSDTDPDPVRDARGMLDDIGTRFPGVPVVLVGHSMGGRTSCRVADDPNVVGVCALAPWLPAGEPHRALRDRALRVMHGSNDRWTSAALSHSFVERCRPIAREVSWTSMPGAGHFMLRRVSVWNRFVKESIEGILGLAVVADHPNERSA